MGEGFGLFCGPFKGEKSSAMMQGKPTGGDDAEPTFPSGVSTSKGHRTQYTIIKDVIDDDTDTASQTTLVARGRSVSATSENTLLGASKPREGEAKTITLGRDEMIYAASCVVCAGIGYVAGTRCNKRAACEIAKNLAAPRALALQHAEKRCRAYNSTSLRSRAQEITTAIRGPRDVGLDSSPHQLQEATKRMRQRSGRAYTDETSDLSGLASEMQDNEPSKIGGLPWHSRPENRGQHGHTGGVTDYYTDEQIANAPSDRLRSQQYPGYKTIRESIAKGEGYNWSDEYGNRNLGVGPDGKAILTPLEGLCPEFHQAFVQDGYRRAEEVEKTSKVEADEYEFPHDSAMSEDGKAVGDESRDSQRTGGVTAKGTRGRRRPATATNKEPFVELFGRFQALQAGQTDTCRKQAAVQAILTEKQIGEALERLRVELETGRKEDFEKLMEVCRAGIEELRGSVKKESGRMRGLIREESAEVRARIYEVDINIDVTREHFAAQIAVIQDWRKNVLQEVQEQLLSIESEGLMHTDRLDDLNGAVERLERPLHERLAVLDAYEEDRAEIRRLNSIPAIAEQDPPSLVVVIREGNVEGSVSNTISVSRAALDPACSPSSASQIVDIVIKHDPVPLNQLEARIGNLEINASGLKKQNDRQESLLRSVLAKIQPLGSTLTWLAQRVAKFAAAPVPHGGGTCRPKKAPSVNWRRTKGDKAVAIQEAKTTANSLVAANDSSLSIRFGQSVYEALESEQSDIASQIPILSPLYSDYFERTPEENEFQPVREDEEGQMTSEADLQAESAGVLKVSSSIPAGLSTVSEDPLAADTSPAPSIFDAGNDDIIASSNRLVEERQRISRLETSQAMQERVGQIQREQATSEAIDEGNEEAELGEDYAERFADAMETRRAADAERKLLQDEWIAQSQREKAENRAMHTKSRKSTRTSNVTSTTEALLPREANDDDPCRASSASISTVAMVPDA